MPPTMTRALLARAPLGRIGVLSRHLAPVGGAAVPDLGPGSAVGLEEGNGRRGGARRAGVAASVLGLASAAALSQDEQQAACEAAKPPALNPKEFLPFKLHTILPLNHNTHIYRFELEPGQALGMTVASCLVTRAPIGPPGDEGNPKPVIRPYTPITQPHVEGYFDLLVKEYPTGKMSRHIASLRPGDTLEIKGPIPKLPYTPNMKRQIGMVAGGTGITPMLQVIDAVLANPEDKTQVSLVFANTSPADVLLKEQLEEYAAKYPNFKVFFVVDKANPAADGWKGGVGYVSSDILAKALPPPGPDSLVLVCGPPGMMRHVSGDKAKDKTQGEVEGLLKVLGYSKDQVYKF